MEVWAMRAHLIFTEIRNTRCSRLRFSNKIKYSAQYRLGISLHQGFSANWFFISFDRSLMQGAQDPYLEIAGQQLDMDPTERENENKIIEKRLSTLTWKRMKMTVKERMWCHYSAHMITQWLLWRNRQQYVAWLSWIGSQISKWSSVVESIKD